MKTLLILMFAAALNAQPVDLSGLDIVPYSGATRGLDLRPFSVAAQAVQTEGSGPSRFYLTQGACSSGSGATTDSTVTPPRVYDAVLCLAGGVIYLVTQTSKTPLGALPVPTLQLETFQLSAMVIATGQATITLAKTPAPGTKIEIVRSNRSASLVKKIPSVGVKAIPLSGLPAGPYISADVIQVEYYTLEP